MVLLCALAVFGIIFAYRWKYIRDELLLIVQPRYRVTQISPADGLMRVEGINESFVVRCHDLCGSFVAGRKYPMLYRGATLEFRLKGAIRELEIVEIQVKPPTLPGGMG
jgi:hypothetical protein